MLFIKVTWHHSQTLSFSSPVFHHYLKNKPPLSPDSWYSKFHNFEIARTSAVWIVTKPDFSWSLSKNGGSKKGSKGYFLYWNHLFASFSYFCCLLKTLLKQPFWASNSRIKRANSGWNFSFCLLSKLTHLYSHWIHWQPAAFTF